MKPGRGKLWSLDKSGTYYARPTSVVGKARVVDPRFIEGSALVVARSLATQKSHTSSSTHRQKLKTLHLWAQPRPSWRPHWRYTPVRGLPCRVQTPGSSGAYP